MKTRLFCLLICIYMLFPVRADEIGRFTVQLEAMHKDIPVAISLDQFSYNTDKGSIALFEVTGAGETFVPSQVEAGYNARVWFIPSPSEQLSRTFVLKYQGDETKVPPVALTIEKDEKDLMIKHDESPVLKYRYAETYPPEGVDPLFKRSGFVHPLWSPGGEVLTRIQPLDHYHHYGIWAPWTMTRVEGRKVDFWNLASGEGTVIFSKFLSEVSGTVYAGFQALQEHIDFGAKGFDQTAINEVLDIRVWNTGGNVWIIDYTSTMTTPLDDGILLEAYRYGGGIGFRAIEKWTKDNSTVLTSEGKTRLDADGSRARWCLVEGETDAAQGRSGILFLSHPANRMHPEPMRVWPIDANGGRGDLFFEFTPIRYEDWELKPFIKYALRYRMVVFDGEMEPEMAERYWYSFATQPKIEIN
jgi:hypothetical protein